MNTATVVVFAAGAILIYTSVKGDGAGGYNPVVLVRGVLSGKYSDRVPEKPKNPSGFDLRPDRPASMTPQQKYYSQNVPI